MRHHSCSQRDIVQSPLKATYPAVMIHCFFRKTYIPRNYLYQISAQKNISPQR